jgi:hypothetical protein
MYISDILHDKRTPIKDDSILDKIAEKLGIDQVAIREAALVTKFDQNIDKATGENANAVKFALARKIISTELTDEQIKELSEELKALLKERK